MPFSRAVFFVGLIVLASGVSPAADAACVRPDVETFMKEARDTIDEEGNFFDGLTATFLAAKDGAQDIQWMGAGWEKPVNGALFVLDCQGKALASLKLGGQIKLRRGPKTPIGETVEVVFRPGVAAAIKWTDVAIVHFQGSSIDVLWRHSATEANAMIEEDFADTYAWKFSAKGKKITLTGKRKVGEGEDKKHGWKPHTTHALPTETFCWNDGEKKYLSCK